MSPQLCPSSSSPQLCLAVALLCGAWNLYGDVCFIDFYLAHMTFDGFGTVASTPRPGNLFDFSKSRWPLQLAQAGGWMYPLWAYVTCYPLYVGLARAGWWCSTAPCALLAYGLCIVGGALHSGFAFTTVLPLVLHQRSPTDTSCADDFFFLAQKRVMESYVFGYTPGPLAVIAASVWIVVVVLTKETMFPRWFVLFTPLVTVMWVAAVGFLLTMSIEFESFGMYVVGSFGTWIILVMNVATCCILCSWKNKGYNPIKT